jgi:S1-C subfamily serine protease
VGLKATVTEDTARARDGDPLADLGVWAWNDRSNGMLRVRISRPDNAWGSAGLHTGDELVTVNGTRVASWLDFRTMTRQFQIGDTVHMEIRRDTSHVTIAVPVPPLRHKTVRVANDSTASARAIRLRTAWEAGQ